MEMDGVAEGKLLDYGCIQKVQKFAHVHTISIKITRIALDISAIGAIAAMIIEAAPISALIAAGITLFLAKDEKSFSNALREQ